MTRQARLLLPVLLLLAACATRQGFDARQSALIGKSEAELVQALGVPVRVHEAEGRRFLQYEDRRVFASGATYAGLGFVDRRYGYGLGATPLVESRQCDVTYELRNGRVIGYTARGNACVAAAPAAGAS